MSTQQYSYKELLTLYRYNTGMYTETKDEAYNRQAFAVLGQISGYRRRQCKAAIASQLTLFQE